MAAVAVCDKDVRETNERRLALRAASFSGFVGLAFLLPWLGAAFARTGQASACMF